MARAHQPWCISTLLVQVLPWTQLIRSHPSHSVSSTNDGLRKFVYMKRRKQAFLIWFCICVLIEACACCCCVGFNELFIIIRVFSALFPVGLHTGGSLILGWLEGSGGCRRRFFNNYYYFKAKDLCWHFSVALQRIFSAHLLHCCCVDPILYF